MPDTKHTANPIFNHIDAKLNDLARQLGTTVATNGGGQTVDGIKVPEDKLEMRRIVWIDGSIGKAIINAPNFESRNIDTPHWDFANLAWLIGEKSTEQGIPFWKKNLLKNVKFENIESSIDQLLKKSLENLTAIKKSDLGYDGEQEEN